MVSVERSLLMLAVLIAAPVRAETMIEVPTPPEVRQRIEDARPKPPPIPTVPAPSPTDPLPSPIVAPPPPLPPTHWRVRRRLEISYLGIGAFGTAYIMSLVAVLVVREWRLDVPLVGPALEMPRSVGGAGPGPAMGLFFDLAVQAGGLVMVAVGAGLQRQERVYDR